jgi:hypothetical protein
MRGNWGFRAVALLAVGALGLHELSYWLTDGAAPGGHAHSYMPLAAGLVTVVLLLACASFARTLVHALRGIEDEGHPPSFRVLWPLVTIALLSVFTLQEWVEGWVTPGHPGGLAHVGGHVGIRGLAVSALIGAAIALLLRGARSAVRAIARRRAPRRRRRSAAPAPALPLFFVHRLDVIAGNLAGRAPPHASY